jgi:uncharacterized membrane protein YhhN
MLVAAIMVAGLLYIWAEARQIRPMVYLLKPGTMALIIWLAADGQGANPTAYTWLILAGLLLSLVGDVLLMLPRDRFVGGLAAFLVAHLCYIAAIQTAGGLHLAGAAGVAGALLVGAGLFMYGKLSESLREQGRAALIPPVVAYIIVILLMAWSAVASLFQPAHLPFRPLLTAAGALLFLFSDGALAWDRFIRPLPWRSVLVMGAYFAAQICFAGSVAWPPS